MNKVIDIELGTMLAGGNKELAIELLGMLKSTLVEDKEKILNAFESQNLAETQKLVHKLHGSLSYTGTPQLKEATYNLEVALKSKETNKLADLVNVFAIAVDDVMEAQA